MLLHLRLALSVFLLLTCVAASPPAAPRNANWPQWRGPNRDGLSADVALRSDWNATPPQMLWSADGLGRGYASIAVADGRIYSTGDRGNQEYVVAVQLSDGAKLWETPIGPASAANCTPTLDAGRLYVLGVRGDLVCLDAANGKIVWRRQFARDFDGKMMSGWGYCESPLVDGERLVCTPGGPKAGMVALDKATGEEIWRCAFPDLGPRGNDGAGYSSIVVSEARGVRQYVQLTGRGVVSVAADDGRFLWGYNRVANGTANIPTPIVQGDYVFCSSGYGTGAALLRVSGSGLLLDVEEVYFLEARTFQNHHGGMVLVGDHVYCGMGHNNGFPVCVDLATGKVSWFAGRGPGTGSAAVTYADGHLYFRYENGLMALIEATPEEYRLDGTFEIPEVHDPSWSHPVVTGGRLYLREQDRLYCYDVRAEGA